jgi:hypothetical protein
MPEKERNKIVIMHMMMISDEGKEAWETPLTTSQRHRN